MTIRQIKHSKCHTIVVMHTEPQVRTDRAMPSHQAIVPTPVLYCPTCKVNVPMNEITPKGAVCVLFTQK